MSGYAYLGHARLLDVAAQLGTQIRFHPLDMAKVFAAAGSFPPAKYPEVRQKHRKADMARWAAKLDLPFNDTPAFWPVPMEYACTVITAAKHVGADQGAVSQAILSAVWAHNLNISDAGDVEKVLELHGLEAKSLLEMSQTSDVLAQSAATTQHAIEIGIFGSPTYIMGDDWFFGQDRLEFLRSHGSIPA